MYSRNKTGMLKKIPKRPEPTTRKEDSAVRDGKYTRWEKLSTPEGNSDCQDTTEIFENKTKRTKGKWLN